MSNNYSPADLARILAQPDYAERNADLVLTVTTNGVATVEPRRTVRTDCVRT